MSATENKNTKKFTLEEKLIDYLIIGVVVVLPISSLIILFIYA